jgi:arsenical pump membrane protein
MSHMNTAIYCIAGISIAGVIFRPFKLPEAVFATAGVIALLLFRLIPPSAAWTGIARGTDVYLFLTGMMLLAETAREEKVFDWLAACATRFARGSTLQLFFLIYGVGTLVTTFLSNDATAVVLTPAVAAAAATARIEKPLPYLYICAFVANAASFVLPISNPANLVLYGSHMPPLLHWLALYLLPAVIAISATCFLLYLSQKKNLRQPMRTEIDIPPLGAGGRLTLYGIAGTALILLVVSAADSPLGLATAITGMLTTAVVLVRGRRSPVTILKNISWSILPLVAGLFVIVEALGHARMIASLGELLQRGSQWSAVNTAAIGGGAIAVAGNLANNLPVGLVAAGALQHAPLPELVKGSILIGVDLGPNLSVTGSLATILWLTALRREGITVSAGKFLKLGFLIMFPPLLLSLLMLYICSLF